MRTLGLALAFTACRAPSTPPRTVLDHERAAVAEVLDGLHRDAAAADEASYFARFAPDAVFLGTDASERWTLPAFRAYAHPHFAAGRGWSYEVLERNLAFAPTLDTAWFDERLANASYGECRGTGVLCRVDGSWRVAQYNLTIPVPNELAADLVRRIRERPAP